MPRGGKPTPVITFGHSKDHRPDLKQLVWILTVAGDGAVPIAYRLADGNTTDDPTHVPTWDQLVGMLGRADFLYVADSKLCSREAMGHIAAAGGRFVTVLPRSRSEDRWFRDWAQTHQPQWTEAVRLPGPRADEPDQVYSVFAAPLSSAEGYRIVWVHATAKAARAAAARQARIEAGAAAIDALAVRLAGPKCRLKTRVAVDQPAPTAAADGPKSHGRSRRRATAQPNLERRHHLLKSCRTAPSAAQPGPHRGLFCCQFLALLLAALIERQIRTAMTAAATDHVPLYPELRACATPTTERIVEILADLTRHELHQRGHLVQTFEPEINPLQQQVLELLGVPTSAYTSPLPTP